MSFFDFLFGKSDKQNPNRIHKEQEQTYPVSKMEMQEAQAIAKKLDMVFYHSVALEQLDNRNLVMHSRMLSYRSMLAYIYEHDYKYGNSREYIDREESSHYQLVFNAMSNKYHRDASVAQLSNNWMDVLKVVEALKMAEPNSILPMNEDIKKLTHIINKIR